jgi:hypothetical protein
MAEIAHKGVAKPTSTSNLDQSAQNTCPSGRDLPDPQPGYQLREWQVASGRFETGYD